MHAIIYSLTAGEAVAGRFGDSFYVAFSRRRSRLLRLMEHLSGRACRKACQPGTPNYVRMWYTLRAVVRNFEPAAHAYSLSLKSASLPLPDCPLSSVVVVKQAAV